MLESDFGEPQQIALSTDGEDLPTLVPLIPPGDFVEGVDGRGYNVDDVSEIQQNFQKRGKVKIDFEHASILKAPKGEEVPAAGWLTGLDATDLKGKGLWGRVEWTDKGARNLREKNYRDISPAFYLKGGTRSIKEIPSVGLVSIGNFQGLVAMNRAENNKGKFMNQELSKALGLDEGADETAVMQKVNELKAAAEAATAKQQEATTLEKRLEELEKTVAQKDSEIKAIADREIEAELNSAQVAMKITRAQRAHFKKVCESAGIETFREIIKNSVPVAGGTVELNSSMSTPAGEEAVHYSEQQLTALKASGRDPKAFSKYMKAGT